MLTAQKHSSKMQQHGSCLCSFPKDFFLLLSTLYSRSEISFQGDLNTTQALSHPLMGCFTPRELLEVISSAEEIVGKYSAGSFWFRAFGTWKLQPKMGNPSFTLLVLHVFTFIIWEDELPGWRFGFSESPENVMTVPLTSIAKRKITKICPTASED